MMRMAEDTIIDISEAKVVGKKSDVYGIGIGHKKQQSMICCWGRG